MTIFTTTSYPVGALIADIDLGKVGLPDLQRPFVWANVKVRNLFDSLYKGYPAGFLLFWDTGAEGGLKGIGAKNSKAVPKLAIVDGQQRLTSLYAVVKGEEVIRGNFKKERIRIAFNPLTERFAVWDAAIVKDKSFIPDISELWRPEANVFSIAGDFLDQLSSVRELSDADKKRIQNAIGKLHGLTNQYSFTALTLSAMVDGATVADVFVRINGEGKQLNQSDFIMTLMSVYWDEGRTELEAFARAATKPHDGHASPFNHFIKPAPDQMLRATIGLALKRARLENVYNALRGRDAKTGIDNPERRDEQFQKMQAGQAEALNLANWHHFLSALTLAGYRGEKMISSETAIIYSYVLYLVGIVDYGIDKQSMRQAIAEFFFMAALTGRYTNSPETRFEADLALVRDLSGGTEYLAMLRKICATTLTPDYWSITLPSQLATSASQSPSLFAYNASLIKLDACALYSPVKIASLVDPAVKGTKVALERHHLFPRAHLEETGIRELKKINQIANFAPVEWPENIRIGKKPPSAYVPPLDAALSAEKRTELYFWHALPHLWWEMPYEAFLVERRERMARVIEAAWKLLNGNGPSVAKAEISVAELIETGETDAVEFKSTLRVNLHTGQQDDKIHVSALKTIAGFLNAKGGTLLLGVADNGEVLGLEADGFPDEDKMALHLANLITSRLGDIFRPYVHPRFEEQDGVRVLMVRVEPGPREAFLKDGNLQRFFVRGGNATAELQGNAITEYVKQRFGKSAG
ncbi:DUF262 domain-containing protein [Paracoccus sp. M683]|jgi:hypothetical protein|uniref:DUF262 domain-containing protein n=2 Tax=Bacteria TaxID=2 RepID=A0A533I2G6_PARDE|nr:MULTISPECIES: DUF262 domain-containing protein [Alphaproteobacteria]MCO6388718.1 DUF262 domain-containing protein [Aliihoeflea sp. 40Bstr573]TKW64707.1 MAG: DUF262 domain-containing protein [Paracoccus denitrificans]TRW93244.1 DUF262 domain-containing protein [Paracoccus sp. M683]